MEPGDETDGWREDRTIADEYAYMRKRAIAHEELVSAATDEVSRAIHLRLQRLYEEQAQKLRLVDTDHPTAQEY